MKIDREKWGVAARKCLGDKRLEEFLRACRGATHILACGHINEELDQGETFDSIFYTQDDYGYQLAVRECGKDEFEISFGYLAGPLMGTAVAGSFGSTLTIGSYRLKKRAIGFPEEPDGGQSLVSYMKFVIRSTSLRSR